MLITDIKGARLLGAILKHKIDVSKYNNEEEIRAQLNRISRNKHYNIHKKSKHIEEMREQYKVAIELNQAAIHM